MRYVVLVVVTFFVRSSLFSNPLPPPLLASAGQSEIIQTRNLCLQVVTSHKDDAFYAICDMYKLSPHELLQELEGESFWCIYNKKTKEAIGAIQLTLYHSLQALKNQVTDTRLADYLYSSKRGIELSYALTEHNQGKGFGSEAVQAFIEYARSCTLKNHLFAVVSDDNPASIRILQKNNFIHIGTYYHPELQENIRLYVL